MLKRHSSRAYPKLFANGSLKESELFHEKSQGAFDAFERHVLLGSTNGCNDAYLHGPQNRSLDLYGKSFLMDLQVLKKTYHLMIDLGPQCLP